jgi:SulP family sulfate permease
VGDLSSIEGRHPAFHLPAVPLTFETLQIVLPYGLIFAAIGLIESLLTLNMVGEITGKRGGASQECVAQGVANTVTGVFGGMGGCAMIGHPMISVSTGARTRIAGIAAALFLLALLLFAAPAIERILLAALVAVMFMLVTVVAAPLTWQLSRRMVVPRPKRGAPPPSRAATPPGYSRNGESGSCSLVEGQKARAEGSSLLRFTNIPAGGS